MLKEILSFVGGAAISGGIVYYFTKKKYKDIADEEIESMREYYKDKEKSLENRNKELIIKAPETESEIDEVKEERRNRIPEEAIAKSNAIIDSNGYVSYDVVNDKKIKSMRERKEAASRIYRISRAQYENDETYDKVTLSYYSLDDILTDERDAIIENRDVVIDGNNLNYFGDPEEGFIIVRNENFMTDYEVELIDDVSYYDVTDA